MNVLMEPEHAESSIDAIVQLMAAQRAEWDYIEFADSEELSPAMTRLCQGLQDLGMTTQVTSVIDCPYTVLPPTFEEYLAGVGANLRYNFRRRWRALEREGSVEFLTLAGGPELHERFGELVQLHRLRFGNQGKRSSFLAPEVQTFHADALTRLAAGGLARLFLLQVGGRTVAALYGFSSGKTFSFFQSGMDPAWAKLSVGLVLMGCSIREAIHSGHDHFDFLRGDEAYKFQWATKTRRVATVCLFDRRLRSRVCARFYAWSFEQLKRLARRHVLPLLGRLATQRQATENESVTRRQE
jgi:CelD/BcsL family acetyltransferase involved in cellulose biosynthesis